MISRLFFVFVTINEVEVSVAVQVAELHWIARDIISSKQNRDKARPSKGDSDRKFIVIYRAINCRLGYPSLSRVPVCAALQRRLAVLSNKPAEDCVRQARSMVEALKEAQEFAAIKTVSRN